MLKYWMLAAAFGAALGTGAARADDNTVTIGMILPMTGPFASTGKQERAAAELYMQQHGDTVAGKTIAAQDCGRKVAYDWPNPIGFRYTLRNNDEPARQAGLGGLQPDRTLGGTSLPPLLAQRMQIGQSPLVAGAASGHPVAQPILLHRDFAPELVVLALLLFQHGVAPRLERLEPLVEGPGNAAVDPDCSA